jgi:hypothetical protein
MAIQSDGRTTDALKYLRMKILQDRWRQQNDNKKLLKRQFH